MRASRASYIAVLINRPPWEKESTIFLLLQLQNKTFWNKQNILDTLSFSTACCTHRVDGVDQLAGLAELHEALPQVVEGPLHQDLLLLVVVQQVVPQGLLGQGLGVSHNDHTIPTGTEAEDVSNQKT